MLINSWFSQSDAMQLFERCIDASFHLKFAIVHGLSRNIFNRMDINSTRQLLNYDPQDDFFQAQESFKSLNITDGLRTFSLQ
jgi:uronate dehydrogenase